MTACFTVIGSIVSTTQKSVSEVRPQAKKTFYLWTEQKKIKIRVNYLKITLKKILILQKGKFLLTLL